MNKGLLSVFVGKNRVFLEQKDAVVSTVEERREWRAVVQSDSIQTSGFNGGMNG